MNIFIVTLLWIVGIAVAVAGKSPDVMGGNEEDI